MSRKAREQLFQQLHDSVQRFSPDDESLTRAEVQDMLRAAGCNPEALRERLNATARALANAQRAKGKPAPEYLQQAIDLTSPPEVLPQDERSALQKAREWIQGMTAGPGIIAGNLEFVRNYRSSGDVSKEDKLLLDKAEESLRKELEEKSHE